MPARQHLLAIVCDQHNRHVLGCAGGVLALGGW